MMRTLKIKLVDKEPLKIKLVHKKPGCEGREWGSPARLDLSATAMLLFFIFYFTLFYFLRQQNRIPGKRVMEDLLCAAVSKSFYMYFVHLRALQAAKRLIY